MLLLLLLLLDFRRVPEELMARIFEPYVTTKARGTGLGLAIVKKIVEEHQGNIHIENLKPHGALIGISLPVYVAAEALVQ